MTIEDKQNLIPMEEAFDLANREKFLAMGIIWLVEMQDQPGMIDIEKSIEKTKAMASAPPVYANRRGALRDS